MVDTNILVYAAIHSSARHPRAKDWLNAQFASPARVGLPWHSLLGYVRLVSNRNTYPVGPSASDAWSVVRKWRHAPNVWIPQPTEQHGDVIDALFASTNITSNAVMDVHLAALAIEHGLTLCSADNGFARYRDLRWLNPLED